MPIPLLLHGKHGGPLATYQPWGPWIVPWRFQAFDVEYEALRTHVGLLDYSIQALIEIRGADRVDFLHRLLTNDIKGLVPGGGCQAALLNPSGKLIAPVLVLAQENALWLMCQMPHAPTIMQQLEHYHFSEQVTCTNHERASAVLALQGPRTIAILTDFFGRVISLPQPGDHVTVSFEQIPAWIVRHSLIQEIGVLCLIEARHAQTMWEALQRWGPSDVLRVGWEALNVSRIEAGIPWWGVDMDETNLLPETGVDAGLVSDAKGCYVGQEIVARLRTYGSVSKRLVGLRLRSPHIPERMDGIVRGDEPLGHVTSACDSPALRCPIALGYVKRPSYEPSTPVEIVRGAERLPATVVTLPFTL